MKPVLFDPAAEAEAVLQDAIAGETSRKRSQSARGVRHVSTVISSALMTMEEMLALPEDDVDRELIRGRGRNP